MEDLKLFKELFIDDENISTIGERDFSEFIKRVNRHLSSSQRFEVLEFIFKQIIFAPVFNKENNNEK